MLLRRIHIIPFAVIVSTTAERTKKERDVLHRASVSFILVFLGVYFSFSFFFSFSVGRLAVLVGLLHPSGHIHMHHKNGHKYYTDTQCYTGQVLIYIAADISLLSP